MLSMTTKYILSYGTFGLAIRFYALGICQRPMLDKPVGHLMHIAGGMFVGYNAAKLRKYVDSTVHGAREELLQRRAESSA